jgi:glucose-6-phosphate isomerase
MELNVRAVNLTFDEKTNKLYSDGVEVPSSVRKLSEMKDVIYNKNFINEKNKDDVLYYMFRGAGEYKNATIFEAHKIRYDVTVVMPYDLGGEFNKTLGHYHPICNEKENLAYPEIYEVISGEAMYLLQKHESDDHYDIKLIRARKGDKVIMEPNYGHITINVGKTPLVMANLVNSTFKSDYEPIKRMGGGALFVTNKKRIVYNTNYKDTSVMDLNAPKLQFLDYKKSIYDEYLANPEHFIFLNRPEYLLWKQDNWAVKSQMF